MTVSPVDDSQRKAARVAGFAYLLSVAIVVFAQFGIHPHLIVAGNPAETARNIIAGERLFRIYIAFNLVYSVGVVVLLTALYVILEGASRHLALLAAYCRLVYAVVWVLMTVSLFTALRLLSGPDYSRVLGVDRMQALARLFLSGFDAYYVALLFYGLASTLCAYLWLKSRYIPGVLAAWGVISSLWCAACTFVFLIFPGFTRAVNLWWFDSPMGLFEIATSFWLLFKGLRPSEIPEPDTARAHAT
jgi:Domain of unknown function (DUF4386)